MKDRIITIMCHAKNQICNMNRFVLILLLSLFNVVGAYAFTSMPSYSMRSVNNTSSAVNTSRQENATQYRVSNNAFSSTPTMQVNTIVLSSSIYSQEGFIEPCSESPADPRNIRGPQRAVDEDDKGEEEPETKDPYTPIGDAVLPLLLLAAAYGIYLRRKNRVQTPESGHQQ